MILTGNIGNASITLGVYSEESRIASASISALLDRSVDEYAVLLKGVLEIAGIDLSKLNGCIFSSVVPPLTGRLAAAVQKLTGLKPLTVGPGIKTGFPIRIDQQTQLGGDIVALAAGLLASRPCPAVSIYFGTATTLVTVDRSGALLGVSIAPGLGLSLDALSARTAQLPRISLERPPAAIGRNTQDAMNSGVVFGTASMLDGMLGRIADELGEPLASVTATGSLAELVVPCCTSDIVIDPDLMHRGLYELYKKQQRK